MALPNDKYSKSLAAIERELKRDPRLRARVRTWRGAFDDTVNWPEPSASAAPEVRLVLMPNGNGQPLSTATGGGLVYLRGAAVEVQIFVAGGGSAARLEVATIWATIEQALTPIGQTQIEALCERLEAAHVWDLRIGQPALPQADDPDTGLTIGVGQINLKLWDSP